MKRFLALLLSALMVLSLLTACGDKNSPPDDGDTVVDDNTDAEPDDSAADPYDAVRTYWSEDQLTQAWGPE